MKSQFRCIWFALVLAAGCGGKKDEPTVASTNPPPVFVDDAPKAAVPPVVVSEAPKTRVDVLEVEVMPGKYADCIKLGKEMMAKGDHVKARELFEAAIALDKKKPTAYVELARSYIETNDKALALSHAKKGVKLAPESSSAYNTLGRAELLRFDYEAATVAFRQATELDPDNVWAWNNLGFVELTLKHYQEAVDALVEATSRKGTTGYMWNNLGTAYEHLDELDDARVAFEKGGDLGSAPAKSSRKRLEGVKSIAMQDKAEKPKSEQTFETREPEPEPEQLDDADDDAPTL